jgi:hypothetical protein
MTKQTTKIDCDDITFHGSDAKRVKNLGDATGHVIEYIDWRGNDRSMFIEEKLYDNAKAKFDEEVLHSVITGHYPAKLEYDLD